jgi:hypothetical protein
MRWLRGLWRRLESALRLSPQGRLFFLGMARADDADRVLSRSKLPVGVLRARRRLEEMRRNRCAGPP